METYDIAIIGGGGAGLAAAVAGFVAIVVFYSLVHQFGAYVEEHETTVWQIGSIELWQDYAALCSLPVSLAGYVIGNAWGKRCSS